MKLAGKIKVDFVVRLSWTVSVAQCHQKSPWNMKRCSRSKRTALLLALTTEERDRAHPNHAGNLRSSAVASTLNLQIEHSPGDTFLSPKARSDRHLSKVQNCKTTNSSKHQFLKLQVIQLSVDMCESLATAKVFWMCNNQNFIQKSNV